MLVPQQVLLAATGTTALKSATAEPIRGSTGAATGEVVRVSGQVLVEGAVRPFTLIRKTVRPLTSGRHAQAAKSPEHWAYWRREPLAYAANVLPAGPGLRAPHCYGVFDDAVYLENVAGAPETPDRAAYHLGRWQASAIAPTVSWLAGHQLEQRIAVTRLDWSCVDADARAMQIWDARQVLLNELNAVPRVLSHGDFHLGNNLVADGRDTVAFDWGQLGFAPVGADLAHLALSSLTDPSPAYLAAVGNAFPHDAVLLGYRTTLALTGASRLHWMLSNQIKIPDQYVDFIWTHRPPL